jgi:type III secretion system FlhB-like substrate exporter
MKHSKKKLHGSDVIIKKAKEAKIKVTNKRQLVSVRVCLQNISKISKIYMEILL